MVDIQRKSRVRRRMIRWTVIIVIILSSLGGISRYLSHLKPADYPVSRATVWIDTVKRGSMLRQVKGIGKLVPEEIRWVPAMTAGRVEKQLLEQGARVAPDTVLLELSNPQLELEATNAEWDLKAAEADYENLKVTLQSEDLSRMANTAEIESNYNLAQLKYEANAGLAKDGLYPTLSLKQDKVAAEQLANRLSTEKQCLEINGESIKAQLAASQTRLEQKRAIYELKKSQLDQLKVRAGVGGVLQELSVEVGQQVSPGANLARVANPNKLKAELNISETQAKDIQIGQKASIDTRNGIIPGKVSRIDPAVRDGTVAIDVELEAELPRGARPDLSVDGTIVLENLEDIIYVGRPAQGQPDSQTMLFKLEQDGSRAVRVTVKLGRSSVNTIEIKEGLKPGDKVILSEVLDAENYDSIRLTSN
jgi:HlyD family secretion protein